MNLLPLAFIDEFAGAFGVAAAVLLIGASFALRWQRNRQQFDLMKIAMEAGGPQIPLGPPFWLLSLRESLMIVAVGIGLLGIGVAAYHIGGNVPMPTNIPQAATAGSTAGTTSLGEAMAPAPAGREAPGPPRPPIPPPPNPELEQWHRGQDIQVIGLAAMGCGAILILLGITRLALSPVERKHGQCEMPKSSPEIPPSQEV